MATITIDWLLRGGIAQLGLTSGQATVLMAMIKHRNSVGLTQPSQVRLAADLGLSRQGVQNALGRLRDLGAIIEVEAGKHGRTARYRIGDTRLSPARDANSVGNRDANSTGQLPPPRDANSVGPRYRQLTEPGLPSRLPAEPAESATSPREIPSSQRSAFESVQPQPPRRRPAA